MIIQGKKLEITLCGGARAPILRNGWKQRKTLPFLSIVQCCQGYYEISLDNGPYISLEEGGLFITRPDQVQQIIHHYTADNRPLIAQWAYFSVVYDGFLDITRHLIFPSVLSAEKARPFEKVLSQLSDFAIDNSRSSWENPASELLWEARRLSTGYRLLELLLDISELDFPEEEYYTILPAITKMTQAQGSSDKIHLESLAKTCNLSVTGFTTLFRRLTGDSPMAFFMKQRLCRVATSLLTGKKSLAQLAQENGFCDQFHLSREFKRHYGTSPRQYRQEALAQSDKG